MFAAIDAFEFPELHDESIAVRNFFRQLSRLMTACGVKDFTLKVWLRMVALALYSAKIGTAECGERRQLKGMAAVMHKQTGMKSSDQGRLMCCMCTQHHNCRHSHFCSTH